MSYIETKFFIKCLFRAFKYGLQEEFIDTFLIEMRETKDVTQASINSLCAWDIL